MPNKALKYDIYERIFNFVLNVLKLINKIPRTYANQVIINQITRSATSMGANSQEADGVNSRKDFIHCFTIVRKENKETIYWLRLITALNPRIHEEAELLINEGSEILAIISTIIKKTTYNNQ